MLSSKSNKNTSRIIPFILIISKDDKCVKNQTPSQASRYASDKAKMLRHLKLLLCFTYTGRENADTEDGTCTLTKW